MRASVIRRGVTAARRRSSVSLLSAFLSLRLACSCSTLSSLSSTSARRPLLQRRCDLLEKALGPLVLVRVDLAPVVERLEPVRRDPQDLSHGVVLPDLRHLPLEDAGEGDVEGRYQMPRVRRGPIVLTPLLEHPDVHKGREVRPRLAPPEPKNPTDVLVRD